MGCFYWKEKRGLLKTRIDVVIKNENVQNKVGTKKSTQRIGKEHVRKRGIRERTYAEG